MNCLSAISSVRLEWKASSPQAVKGSPVLELTLDNDDEFMQVIGAHLTRYNRRKVWPRISIMSTV